jgi:hypothetical protein
MMVDRCLYLYVGPLLAKTPTTMVTFDLWMNKRQQDTFFLAINLLSSKCKPSHITMGLFEANDTTR